MSVASSPVPAELQGYLAYLNNERHYSPLTAENYARDIRRLLIVGASAVVCWAARKGAPGGSWLARMMARKPHMLVVVALANKMARTIWALMIRGENYRDPALAT